MLKKCVSDDRIYILHNPAEYILAEKLELTHVKVNLQPFGAVYSSNW